MKLLFVHQNLGEFGGAEANIRTAAKELAVRNHTMILAYHNQTGRNEQDWRQTFSECFWLPAHGDVRKVDVLLKEFKPDLIYLHNTPDLALVRALLDSSIPVVRMVHDHSMYCMRSYKYNYFTRQICRRPFSLYCLFPCLASVARGSAGGRSLRWVSYRQKKRELQLNRRCAYLVVYSEYVKQELARNRFDSRKIMICAPIPIAKGPQPTSSFSNQNLILFAGQIIRGKGVDVLLESLARIKTNFRCVILGEGNHQPYCERLCARLGLAERVQFRGYVLPGELKQFYLEASVFAMSSLWPEPFGMAGPEAMRYGLPVVAFEAGGISEWLKDGENGYLVPWKDTQRFAARLEELLQDKDLARRMGRRALETVSRFDEVQQTNALEQLFQRAVQDRRAEPGRLITMISASSPAPVGKDPSSQGVQL